MKRSVRSGIAIAGLAGGFWLLGQAVADASTTGASPAGGAAVTGSGDAASGSGTTTAAAASANQSGSGSGGNTQSVDAKNKTTNDATAGTVNAGGGTSAVGVIAGNGNKEVAKSDSGDVTAKQNVTTVVWVSSSATGAKVSGSGNAAAGNNASYKANATGTQNNKGGKGSGGNSQDVNAKNYTHNTATGGTINAGGGTSLVGVIAGNHNTEVAKSGEQDQSQCGGGSMEPYQASSLSEGGCQQEWNNKWKHHDKNDGDVNASQNISTKVTVGSSATGAVVDNSGNAAAGNNASYSANANGTQNNESDGKKNHHNRDDCKQEDGGGPVTLQSSDHPCYPGQDEHNGNSQDVDASNGTHNDAQGGDINAGGGTSVVGVIAGNGNTLYCTSKTGNVTCSQNITTIINIISKATGATVTCSGNASAGNSGHIVCQETITPAAQKPVMKPAVKTLVPVSHHTPVLSSTQSSGELAFTGAETSLPLTLGLLALGAGGALSLAGRRRETATV